MIPEEWQEVLYREHPALFSQVQTGFECEKGWFFILKKLAQEIDNFHACQKRQGVEHEHTIASQVKEKFGELRFYTLKAFPEVLKMIDLAEEMSKHTCEYCGNLGSIKNNGRWLYCRCEPCREKIG